MFTFAGTPKTSDVKTAPESWAPAGGAEVAGANSIAAQTTNIAPGMATILFMVSL